MTQRRPYLSLFYLYLLACVIHLVVMTLYVDISASAGWYIDPPATWLLPFVGALFVAWAVGHKKPNSRFTAGVTTAVIFTGFVILGQVSP